MRLGILLLIFFASVLGFAQIQGPKIVVDNLTYDFGNVKAGELVKYKFMIANNGDDLLKIENVITSCGCTAAALDKKELKPGESVPLGIEFNSTGRSGPQAKYISIMCNDKATPQVRLTVKGNVILEPKKDPSIPIGARLSLATFQHDFGIVEEGKKVQYTFNFKNDGDEELKILDIKTSCGCTAAVTESKSYKPGENGTLNVELDTSNRIGRMSLNVSITTNDKEAPLKVLTIYAEVTKKENK